MINQNQLKRITLGSPREYLKLYHYLFLDYSALIAAEIVNKHSLELNLKNDKLFMDGVYKLSRDMLGHIPKLSRDQFFQTGFAQIKALMAVEIIELVQHKLKSLQAAAAVTASASGSTSSILSSLAGSNGRGPEISEHLNVHHHGSLNSPRHKVTAS